MDIIGNESPLEQRTREKIKYKVDTVNWGGSPSNPYVKFEDIDKGYADVTSEVTPTGATVSQVSPGSNILQLPLVYSPKSRNLRMCVGWDWQGSTLECYWILKVKR